MIVTFRLLTLETMAGVLMMSGPVREAAYVCVCCGEMLDRPAEEFKSET